MTVDEILKAMRPDKPVSRAQLYLYLKRFGIKPVGEVRQIPARYPEDAASIIRSKLGLPTRTRASGR